MKTKINTPIVLSIIVIIGLAIIILCIPSDHKIHDLPDRDTLLSFIAIIVGILGLYYSHLSRKDNIRHNQDNIVLTYTTRYSTIQPKLVMLVQDEIAFETEQSNILNQYYTLSEEELSFIREERIPFEISINWINGIKHNLVELYDLEQDTEDEEPDFGYVSDFVAGYPLLNEIWENYTENNQITSDELRTRLINNYQANPI